MSKFRFFELYFTGDYAAIPARMQDAIKRYVLEGIRPGNFLSAVICNDLSAAVGYADDENLPLLKLYVQWFYNVPPSLCYGSRQVMEDWITARQEEKELTPTT